MDTAVSLKAKYRGVGALRGLVRFIDIHHKWGVVWGHAPPPRKNVNFRPFEIVFGAVLGQNSHQKLVISHRPSIKLSSSERL